MGKDESAKLARILLVDDNTAIHEDFKSLIGDDDTRVDHDTLALEESLFGEGVTQQAPDAETESYKKYTIDSAFQGEEAIEKVQQAVEEGNPYALLFMDVRMPPGMDGIQAVKRIWQKYPNIEVVICTAFSDYAWNDILKELGNTGNLLFMKKPFDATAVKQTAMTLTKKWLLTQENRNYTDHLETEVQKRTAELNDLLEKVSRMKEKAEAATLAKSMFLSNMSHEIRTPLNGVVGLTELLMTTELNTEQREYTENLRDSGYSLKTMVDAILDFSKIESGKMELEKLVFDPRAVVESATDLLAVNVLGTPVEICAFVDAGIPHAVIGDAERIRQILLNLVGNAIKFTESGEIGIRAKLCQQTALENNAAADTQSPATSESEPQTVHLMFEVSDTGKGIDSQALDKLFSPFVQEDESTTRKFGGTGLGLSICKQLCELMGGRIGATSTLGQGSVFTFTVVVQAAETPAMAPVDSVRHDLSNLKCLQVGDNDLSLENTALYVQHFNGKSERASEGVSLLEIVDSQRSVGTPFNMVLVDYRSGDIDAYLDVAQTLAQYVTANTLELVALLPMACAGYHGPLTEAGYKACLTRPLKLRQLIPCLATLANGGALPGVDKTHALTSFDLDYCFPQKFEVLIAEDNLVNQKIIGKLLDKIGLKTDIADDGAAAVAACKKHQYDVIFMDCQMPVMDGYAATEAIRAIAGYEQVPIIAFTGDVFSDNIARCLAAGMTDTLTKPCKFDDVLAVLKKHITHE